MRPTESANVKFREAARTAKEIAGDMRNMDNLNFVTIRIANLAFARAKLAEGLEDLSNGLRATYVLIEQGQGKTEK